MGWFSHRKRVRPLELYIYIYISSTFGLCNSTMPSSWSNPSILQDSARIESFGWYWRMPIFTQARTPMGNTKGNPIARVSPAQKLASAGTLKQFVPGTICPWSRGTLGSLDKFFNCYAFSRCQDAGFGGRKYTARIFHQYIYIYNIVTPYIHSYYTYLFNSILF